MQIKVREMLRELCNTCFLIYFLYMLSICVVSWGEGWVVYFLRIYQIFKLSKNLSLLGTRPNINISKLIFGFAGVYDPHPPPQAHPCIMCVFPRLEHLVRGSSIGTPVKYAIYY